MATRTLERPHAPPRISFAPDGFDRILAAAALILLAAVATAIFRGRAEWPGLPLVLQGHILTIVVAVALTPLMLLRPRGDRLHRRLGWVWAAAMAGTAALSFGVRGLNGGALSFIHILSAWTLIQVPIIVSSARSHNVARHRGAVRGMVSGALIIAGVFTFPFERLMGRWLFG